MASAVCNKSIELGSLGRVKGDVNPIAKLGLLFTVPMKFAKIVYKVAEGYHGEHYFEHVVDQKHDSRGVRYDNLCGCGCMSCGR